MKDHLSGLSFSSLATKYHLSKTTAYRIVFHALQQLPRNNQITFMYCNRFSQILVPDGKYFPIKGYKRNAVLLWGIDYLTHDFPLYFLAPSENYQSWDIYFKSFRHLLHRYDIITCDDSTALKETCRYHFPHCRVQACYVHILRQVKTELCIAKEPTYRTFFAHLCDALDTKIPHNPDYRKTKLGHMLEYSVKKGHTKEIEILQWLDRRYGEELFNYQYVPKTPLTSNVIETFNSHLEARIAGIKGFETYEHANAWLNGYILKRRFTKYTQCSAKFRRFNGKRPIDQTRNLTLTLPDLF
jgi:hypothetical protein